MSVSQPRRKNNFKVFQICNVTPGIVRTYFFSLFTSLIMIQISEKSTTEQSENSLYLDSLEFLTTNAK